MAFDYKKCLRDVKHDRFRFVCSPWEFKARYGVPTHQQAVRLGKYMSMSRDGMIRPK